MLLDSYLDVWMVEWKVVLSELKLELQRADWMGLNSVGNLGRLMVVQTDSHWIGLSEN